MRFSSITAHNPTQRAACRDLAETIAGGEESWPYIREEWQLLRHTQLWRLRYEMVVDRSYVSPMRLRLRLYSRRR